MKSNFVMSSSPPVLGFGRSIFDYVLIMSKMNNSATNLIRKGGGYFRGPGLQGKPYSRGRAPRPAIKIRSSGVN